MKENNLNFHMLDNELFNLYISRIRLYIENQLLNKLLKREAVSSIGFCLRHCGIYATSSEIYRYLNREIEFDKIRDRTVECCIIERV